MFLHLLSTDFRRAIVHARFWILSFCAALLLYCNTLQSGYAQSVSFVSAMTGSGFQFTTQILLILATLGYAAAFCEDWKNRNIRNILIRSGMGRYAVSKVLSCAVTGILILFLGQLLFAGLELLISPSLYGDSGTAAFQGQGGFDALLYEGHMAAWVFLRTFRFSLEGAGFSVFALCVSTQLVNSFVILTVPIFAYFLLDFVRLYSPSLPWYLSVYAVYEDQSFCFQSISVHMLLTVLITALACTLFGYLFYRGVKRRMENG